MKLETYERAKNLQFNINSLEKIIEEVDKDRHWIKLITPRHTDEWFSRDFQKSLLKSFDNKDSPVPCISISDANGNNSSITTSITDFGISFP